MSEAFLNRIKNNRLTNVDQYRRMQNALSEMKIEDQQSDSKKDEWTNWQLAPVESKGKPGDSSIIDAKSETAKELHHALQIMDRK